MPGAASFRRFNAAVGAASALEDRMRDSSDERLRDDLSSLADADPTRLVSAEALAALREIARRTVGLRPVDEQLLAYCALMSGNVVEMDTGEGKTLVGALAAAGYALSGRSVHVLSVNDYLAERDAEWMGGIFALLRLDAGWIGQHTPHDLRREVYGRSIVYVPVSEVGFDLLRDRFATADEDRVDPVFDVAIVDEADAVMIDEAVSPLVLAGESEEAAASMDRATGLARDLVEREHFEIDAERANVTLTDDGLDRIEARLGGANLYASENIAMLTQINLALHARVLVQRDVDYLVEDGEVRLVNAARGRVAHLQRWPDGLHAAVESKEGLVVSAPGAVMDTVTVQDLLVGYTSLAGMSGTALAVAGQLTEFYSAPVGRVERHVPSARIDRPDRIVLSQNEKREALVIEVRAAHELGRPVLIGTQSVAESEELAAALERAGVGARVLNAKNDADEAAVIARAGEYRAVTISTQMSGRGTDIRLGGADGRDHERVAATGGLAVFATSRYPSSRLDAQLRGRSGRQGDPGSSLAFVSLDDDLVQTHAPGHLLTEIAREGSGLAPGRRAKIVDSSQAIAEGIRLDRHRNTWRYNRAITRQRETVLARRREAEQGDAALERMRALVPEELAALEASAEGGTAAVASTVRAVWLFHIDDAWQTHLAVLGEIRDGIHLRALAGQSPADEFHKIALREFHTFFDDVDARSAAFVRSLSPRAVGADLDLLGLKRPSSTWTYMMTDDPIGGPADRFARTLGRTWRQTWNLE
jgi:preprotein translocase subunit SecA